MLKPTPHLLTRNGVNLMISSRCGSLDPYVILFKSKSLPTPGNAKALWDRLKKLFHDNKDARAINLDYELVARSLAICGAPAQPVLFAAHQPHGYGTAQQQQQPVQQQHNLHSLPSNSQGILGAAPALHPSQATSLPSAFSTMTLHDPTWNMDTDNNCTIEFDAFGFSVKDFLTRHILLRCDSSGDLYPVTKPSTVPAAFVSTSSSTWHQRLGHPGDDVLRSLSSRHLISCNKERSPHVCHACQLGKHVKLPFHSSISSVKQCFDIIHSDLWTSPIVSSSGFKYYVLFLDHFSHYLWIYPLKHKSDMFGDSTIINYHTPFWLRIDGIQLRFTLPPKPHQQNVVKPNE
ncbi:ribonuclease H-like domain-containing protein [Tanacetum coccineum]